MIEAKALVTPHVGHGTLKMLIKGQRILKKDIKKI